MIFEATTFLELTVRRLSAYPPRSRMPSEARLTPKERRRILRLLPRDRLAALTDHFRLEVADRRSIDAHVDAIVKKRSLDFRELLEQLRREELQAVCGGLALDAGGREKAKLVDRILGVKEEPGSTAAGSEPPPSMPPPSMRDGGALKSLLRRFTIQTAAEYLSRDSGESFVPRLLACFGWPDAGPPDAAMPAKIEVVDGAQRTTRAVALWWPARRVVVDVVKHDVMLDHAWKDLLRACIQLDPAPQYVVLTNQRDLHLYDIPRDRTAPRLAIALDDLPKYSEAVPFFSTTWVPGALPQIVDVSKVSGQVADLVAKVYRSLKEQHPERERDVVQFVLQCILTMFAEDIGLLPREHFTSLLYDGKRHRDAEKRLGELFRLMSTRDIPGQRVVPYFNGGLFSTPVTVPLGEAQLDALIKASEANWKYVDPHIFGSVFQGIMNDAERHKSGAHYTAHEDLMRVVGPTIVEPWRKRIRDAGTLGELLEVRKSLLAFRVLDPACGSGNFLYVAFRELYKLDTELLARLREFPSTQRDAATRITWGAGIQTSRFFGIDINPFAVALAKVTLNIAKKIAFDERRETAADLFGQVEMETDPSLPLDNLDQNVVCADALFTEWPEVDAIIGNPPFLGDRKIRGELGADYLRRVQKSSGIEGVVDLCCYWFRRAHDRLPQGARAGLVGTSGIRIGKAREASLDYIVAHGGTITNAVSSRLWPGEAALNVAMVNWMKGVSTGPCQLIVEDTVFDLPRIATHLQLQADLSTAKELRANASATSMGVIFGNDGFMVAASDLHGFELLRSKGIIRPVATGTGLLTGAMSTTPDYAIDLGSCVTQAQAKDKGGAAFVLLEQRVRPRVEAVDDKYPGWADRWWQPLRPQRDFFGRLSAMRRAIVCSSPQARPVFAFVSTTFIPTNTLQVFAFDDDYSFGIIQSGPHWEWTKAKGGKVRADIRYTNEVWSTFSWPQEPREEEVVAVAVAGRELRRVRAKLMQDNGWSHRALYQAAEVPGPHPLKDAQAALDVAVRRAYGMPEGVDATEFLLELNKLVVEDEAEGRTVQAPGVPRGLDPKDPRWMSDDCIEPPAAPGK